MVAPSAHQSGSTKSASRPRTVNVSQKILRSMLCLTPKVTESYHARLESIKQLHLRLRSAENRLGKKCLQNILLITMTSSRLRLTLFVLLLCLSLLGCSTKAAQNAGAQPAAPTVEITQVSLSDADIYADYPAQTFARNMVEVRARVDGYIEKWLFRPGQEVEAGAALYVLDLRPYKPKSLRLKAISARPRPT